MKFCETHFDEYISSNQRENLHPKLDKIFSKFPKKITDLNNIIFYGPSGIGKYTQMLKSIKRYSPSELKYEKKISINFNKQCFVLVGTGIGADNQNIGKSTFTRFLCPPKLKQYYTEELSIDKDGIIALSENFMKIFFKFLSFFKIFSLLSVQNFLKQSICL